jgi:hypothetical protein
VNSNPVFQWNYEYRKGILGARSKPTAKQLPVVVAETEAASTIFAVGPHPSNDGTIRVEFPVGVFVHVWLDTDLQLLRSSVEMLRARSTSLAVRVLVRCRYHRYAVRRAT